MTSRALMGFVQIPVGAPPPAPFANGDSFTVTEGAVASVLDVLANDDNVAGFLITIASQPARGSVAVVDDGLATAHITWTDNGSGVGSTSFNYSVDGSNAAVVNLTIEAGAPGALPVFQERGTRDRRTTTSSNLTPGYPVTGLQAGDYFIAHVVVHADTDVNASLPVGWDSVIGGDVIDDLGVFAFLKIATGSESGTASIPWTGQNVTGAKVALAWIVRYSGATAVEASVTASGTGLELLFPDVTAAGVNRRAVALAGVNGNAVGEDNPEGETGGDWVFVARDETNSGDDAFCGLYDAALPSAGTISGGMVEQVSSGPPPAPGYLDRWAMVSFALVGGAGTPPPPPSGFFVATNGNDGNPGTEALPWRTLAFAQTQLTAGTRLNLRGGTYREPPFVWITSGESGTPIVIASHPGEVAVLDACLPEFQSVGNTQWELHDASTETYRSVGTAYQSSSNWWGTFVSQGKRLLLIWYNSLADLMSTTYAFVGTGAYYRGPGFVRHTDGRIYVRLQNLAPGRDDGIPTEAPIDHPIRNTPPSEGGFDPRDFQIHLSTVGDFVQIDADHLTFERLWVHGGRNPVAIAAGRTGLTFDRCRVTGGREALKWGSGASFIHVHHSEIDGAFPPYLSWNEVRTNVDFSPVDYRISFAKGDADVHDVLFEHNIIRGVFEGYKSPEGTNFEIRFLHNTVDSIFDDLFQFDAGIRDFEIGWNFINGPCAGYNGGADPTEFDSKWFHHNVIDVRRDELGRRIGQPGSGAEWRRAHVAFPPHSVGSSNTPAKIYNNTILIEQNIDNTGSGIERVGSGTAGVHETWNNLVLQYDDREYIRNMRAGSHVLSDHNLFWKFSGGGFARFNDWPPSNLSPTTDYSSLSAWRSSQGFQDTKAFYAPGYEANSKELDPQISAGANVTDKDYRPNPTGPAATGAKALASTGWPGAGNEGYFGAVDPNALAGLGDVGHQGEVGPGGEVSEPEPSGSDLTIGAMSGAGNIFRGDSASHKISDLATLHCGMARISASPSNDYFQFNAPSPARMDAVVVALLQAGVQPYFSFVFTDILDSSVNGIPARDYSDWFDIGQAFAERFKKGSSFLVGQGITALGAYGYSAINEPDHDSGEVLPNPPTTFGLTYTQYHDMLSGLADGVHSADPDGLVWPAGYLSGNRDQEYTGHGYCAAVADLINDGTLAGFDLHTYHSMTGAAIHNTYSRSHQHDADNFVTDSGITRQDVQIICTETNIRGDPDATAQGYNETTARNWFLTSMFDVWGTLRPDGTLAQGPRLPWQLWQTGDPVWWMASQLEPRVELWCGHTYKLLLDLLWDMRFTFNDPRGTGVHKLKGGGKTAWVFQNIHSTWSSLSGSTFTISDIPAGTTQVQVYDGNGLIQTVSTPTLQIPSHQFSTPTGKSYLFVANAESTAAGISLDNRTFYDPIGAADPHTFSFTVASGASILLVKLNWENAGTIAAVRWGGPTGTLLTEAITVHSSSNRCAAFYYLINPTPGTQNIWVDLSASFVVAFQAVSLFGTNVAAPVADTDGGDSASAAVTFIQTAGALLPSGSGNWLEVATTGGNATLSHTPAGASIESVDQSVASAFRAVHTHLSGVSSSVQPRVNVDAAASHAMAIAAILLRPAA